MAGAIFYASMNTAGAFLPVRLTFLVPLLILVVFALLYDRMWRRLSVYHLGTHRAVGRSAETAHDAESIK